MNFMTILKFLIENGLLLELIKSFLEKPPEEQTQLINSLNNTNDDSLKVVALTLNCLKNRPKEENAKLLERLSSKN